MLIGLIGKPSTGKSTFFKAATLAEVEIVSYPFTTIKPNHGVGYVKVNCLDKEFSVQPAQNNLRSRKEVINMAAKKRRKVAKRKPAKKRRVAKKRKSC